MTDEYMTKNEYETFVRLQDAFTDCLYRCAIEISLLQHNHKPEGIWDGHCELYDDGHYMVQFETHRCGDYDYDTTLVPIQYIHDEQYRANYGTYLEDERRQKEADKAAEKQRIDDIRIANKEKHDQAEYARLKKKYEVIE